MGHKSAHIAFGTKQGRKALLVDAMGGGLCKIHGEFLGIGKHGLRACPLCDIDAYYKKLKHKGKIGVKK